MQVIPAINCLDLKDAEENLKIVRRLGGFTLKRPDWLHLDYADSRYTFNKTWGGPHDFLKLTPKDRKLNWEVHLMVAEPEKLIIDYLKAGVKRLIVQVETITNIRFIVDESEKYNAELMLSVSPDTPAEALKPYFDKVDEFQILAVHPGLAGQKFLSLNLDKIKFIRRHLPKAKIEVDGGVNAETAEKIKSAGADIITSASYIFDSRSPKRAYRNLAKV